MDSALVVLRRHAPAPTAQLVALVHAAFAHRRKALAGSLALTPGATGDIREAAAPPSRSSATRRTRARSG